MILLIPAFDAVRQKVEAIFKFHYDSINSYRKLAFIVEDMKFKFHYDSINSSSTFA